MKIVRGGQGRSASQEGKRELEVHVMDSPVLYVVIPSLPWFVRMVGVLSDLYS